MGRYAVACCDADFGCQGIRGPDLFCRFHLLTPLAEKSRHFMKKNLATLILVLFVVSGLGAEECWLMSKAHRIPRHTTSEESDYFSLIEGNDKQLYIGTAKYQDNAYLVQYDPGSEVMEIVVDCEIG